MARSSYRTQGAFHTHAGSGTAGRFVSIPHPVALASVSGTSASISFVATTLPYLQWLAVLVAVVSGSLSIILAIRRLREK